MNRRRTLQLLLVFGLGMALAIKPAAAQQPREASYHFSASGSNGLVQLGVLQHESVRSELELSAQQTSRIDELLEEQHQWFRAQLNTTVGPLGAQGRLPPRSGAARPPVDFAKQREQEEQRSQELDRTLASLLGAKKQGRLKQIGLQQQGGWALNDPKVAEALQLTAEQKEQVRTIATEGRFRMRRPGVGRPAAPRVAPQATEEDPAAARAQTSDKLLGILSAEQRTKWQELLGAPFTGDLSE